MRQIASPLLALILLAVVNLAWLSMALGADGRTATNVLKEFTDYNLTICGTGARRAINTWRAGGQVDEQYEFGECIVEARIEGKKLYATALTEISEKNATKEALKDYFATWLTALANVKPHSYETLQSYNDRQSDYAAKAELLWNKFELESE